ncbi:MAG: hypothetical protein JW917_01810 [Ignavibacteria bacterium]|nr:hypothetical protein [Ignavibacteria bacterium]
MKAERDVKFVIYQVLYIFVVCVIALKGANLDLAEVISKEKVVERQYADSLKAYIDSLLALGLVPKIEFDTNVKIQDLAALQEKLRVMQTQLQVVQTSPTFVRPELTPPELTREEEKPKEEIKEDEQKIQANVQIGGSFTQYLTYTVKNPYNGTLVISADGKTLASIAQGGSATFTLGGESSITYRVGESSDTKAINKKPPPEINMTRLAPSGEDVSLRTIQSQVGYRVTIKDLAPAQLKVNISGPVRVTQSGSGVYDITLAFLTSKSAFDNYTEGRDDPYSVGFNVTVVDAAGTKITRNGQFVFGEW